MVLTEEGNLFTFDLLQFDYSHFIAPLTDLCLQKRHERYSVNKKLYSEIHFRVCETQRRKFKETYQHCQILTMIKCQGIPMTCQTPSFWILIVIYSFLESVY